MIDRRALLAAAPLALLPAIACAAADPAAQAVLERAIARAGGRVALHAASVLAWKGEAVVYAGGKRVDIVVDTVVRPFAYARSRS